MDPQEILQLKRLKELLVALLGTEELAEIDAIPDEKTHDVDVLSQILPLLEKVNTAYSTSRDDTAKLEVVSGQLENLKELLALCSSEEMQPAFIADNNQPQQAIAQLHFKISQYYSIIGDDAACIAWLMKAEEFVKQDRGLLNTRTHAILLNLMGGHYSRLYDDGKVPEHDIASVDYFRKAVSIYRDSLVDDYSVPLEVSLNSAEEQHYRHVVMCLGCALAKTVESRAINKQILSSEDASLLEEASTVLSELTPDNLVNKDGSPDYYRLAGTDQWKAKVMLYQRMDNSELEALSLCMRALTHMREHNKLNGGNAIGQLQMIQDDLAFTARVVAHCLELKTLELGKTIEPMYFERAFKSIEESSDPKAFAVAKVLRPDGYAKYQQYASAQQQPKGNTWFSGWTPGYDRKTALLGATALVGTAAAVIGGQRFSLRN